MEPSISNRVYIIWVWVLGFWAARSSTVRRVVCTLLDLVGYLLMSKDAWVVQMLFFNRDLPDFWGRFQKQLQLRIWEAHARAILCDVGTSVADFSQIPE